MAQHRRKTTERKGSRPVVFVSHASPDSRLAQVLKREIEHVFDGAVSAFVSASLGDISPGSDWLEAVNKNLDLATEVIALVSPASIERPWVWFELGASWSRMTARESKICPICVPPIHPSGLPEPMSRLQAVSFESEEQVTLFFIALSNHLGIGMKGVPDAREILAAIPDYGTSTPKRLTTPLRLMLCDNRNRSLTLRPLVDRLGASPGTHVKQPRLCRRRPEIACPAGHEASGISSGSV